MTPEWMAKLLPILAPIARSIRRLAGCLEAGAADYIAKAVNSDELIGLLGIRLFGKQRMRRGGRYDPFHGEHSRR